MTLLTKACMLVSCDMSYDTANRSLYGRKTIEHVEQVMDCVFVPLLMQDDVTDADKSIETLHRLASHLQITAGNKKARTSHSSQTWLMLFLSFPGKGTIKLQCLLLK